MAMFSQKRSFFKGKLFYIILIGLFAFGMWINQPLTNKNAPEDVSADKGYSTATNSAVNQSADKNVNYNIMDNIIGKSSTTTPGGIENKNTAADNQEKASNKGYYLVKAVDGVIKIFYYDDQGKESLIKVTDIAFSLLSVGDQALFQKGIIKHSEDELNELLQDFES
jgi:hypothetical protein